MLFNGMMEDSKAMSEDDLLTGKKGGRSKAFNKRRKKEKMQKKSRKINKKK